MASDQQEAWLIMPGKAGSNVMTGVNSLPNDETDAAELRKAQSFGSSVRLEGEFMRQRLYGMLWHRQAVTWGIAP